MLAMNVNLILKVTVDNCTTTHVFYEVFGSALTDRFRTDGLFA
jgi:hypothetical protein